MKTQKFILAAALAIAATTAYASHDYYSVTGRPYGNARLWEHHPNASRYPLWYDHSVRYQGFESDRYLNERDVYQFERPAMSGKDPRFDAEWREMRERQILDTE
jgi:hypothetical protein